MFHEKSIRASAAPAPVSGAQALLDRGFDLTGLGEAAEALLREERLAVERDLEDAAMAFDQLGGEAQLLFDLLRQPGGAGEIASSSAVLDLDPGVHGWGLLSPV